MESRRNYVTQLRRFSSYCRFCFAPPLHPRKSRFLRNPTSAIAWRSGANRRRDKKVSLIDCIYSRRNGGRDSRVKVSRQRRGNEVTRRKQKRNKTDAKRASGKKGGKKRRKQIRSIRFPAGHTIRIQTYRDPN